jgi:hypothetical protein
MGKKTGKDRPAVIRVKGGSAPPPLAPTRSGARRPKAGPVTIRRVDGSVETVSAKGFRDQHPSSGDDPDAQELAQLRSLAAAFRNSGSGQHLKELRRFGERTGRELEVERALSRISRSGPESAHWR